MSQREEERGENEGGRKAGKYVGLNLSKRIEGIEGSFQITTK